jgi:sulfonate transport system substrate-binding protein
MTVLTRRAVLGGARSLVLSGLLAGCGKDDAKDLGGLTLRAATYRGTPDSFFDKAGQANTPYKVETSQFAGGNLITEAINARAIDFGMMSEIPPIFVADARPLLRIVAVLEADVNNQVVLVPKGSAVDHPKDLKGKRVGYVRATTSQYMLLHILKEQGLAWTDITPVALTPQDGLAAFQNGNLDAWVIYGVIVYLAIQDGARVLTTGQGILSGNYLICTSKDVLSDSLKKKAVGDYLQRFRAVVDWIEADPERWAVERASATGIAADFYRQEIRGRSGPFVLKPISEAAIRSQQAVADGFSAAGVLPGKVDVSPLWDAAYTDLLKKA